jgi:dienelactone hydrolase
MKGEQAVRFKVPTLLALLAIVVGLAACGTAAPPPVPTPTISPAPVWEELIPFDSDSESLYEKNLRLFDYDQQAPLDVQEVESWGDGDVTVHDITYASPKGGRVPATLVVPDGAGPFAGIVVQHGMPSNRQGSFLLGRAYASLGAVVILIDAPFARPENADREPLTLTEQDREEQIQLIVDLRRAVDLLVARSDVDPDRLAYVGVSYGAAMGGLLAGVEDRLQAYVLQVGDGGLVEHLAGPEDEGNQLSELSQEKQERWIDVMWPIEPIHYVGHAAPAALLFQNGIQDQMVPLSDGARYQEAGSEPKTIMWYESGHFLPRQSVLDQARWLRQYTGIEDPDEIVGDLILLERVEPLMLLVPSFRQAAPVVDRLLVAWFLLAAGSLIFLIWDLWRGTPAPWGIKLIWLLVVVFLGPLGLLAYFISYRHPGRASSPGAALTSAKRALGSTSWSVAGNLAGGLLVIWILLRYASIAAILLLSLVLIVALPFFMGLLIFRAIRWSVTRDARYRGILRRPPLAELTSTNMVLAGAYPVVIILIDRWLVPWYPLGFDLTNPLLWGILSLGAIAGSLVAYPLHVWMIRSGLVRWGVPSPAGGDNECLEPEAPKLPWFKALGIILLTYAVLAATIVVSLMLA